MQLQMKLTNYRAGYNTVYAAALQMELSLTQPIVCLGSNSEFFIAKHTLPSMSHECSGSYTLQVFFPYLELQDNSIMTTILFS